MARNIVPTPDDSATNRSISPRAEQTSLTSDSPFSAVAAIRFLAPKVFREAQPEISRLDTPIPSDVAAYVGDSQQVCDMAISFFSSSLWMPIICRKSFFGMVLNPLSPPRPELVLLALCMKLFCTPLPSDSGDGQTALYRAAKRFHLKLETAGVMSIRVLQAGVFIAIYETGHAIYPAAYFTVGACARYGAALGLDKLMKDLMGDGELSKSWIEIEEMRRVWWGVLILDRLLNLGCPSRCLATRDPSFDNYLPVDDQLFSDGKTKPEDVVSISVGFSLKMGIFARTAQSMYLISQVLQSLAPTQPQHKTESIARLKEDTSQLRRTLESLVQAAEEEASARHLTYCCQTAVCYCGVLLLQDHYWQLLGIGSNQDAYDHMFPETQPVLDVIWLMASDLRNEVAEGELLDDRFSIFLMQIIYQAASVILTIGQGNPDQACKEKIDTFKWLLQHMRTRWRVAGVYLTILNAHEVALTSATRVTLYQIVYILAKRQAPAGSPQKSRITRITAHERRNRRQKTQKAPLLSAPSSVLASDMP
ncbi:hypothetical protein ACHAQJ_010574 [Trichoderma viride]